VPSYNALLAKLVAQALGEHPELNTSLDGDEIVTWETVDIAIAVDTERGLLVPVVRDVQDKPVRELAREMEDLLARAKAGKATPDELTGSTFTITNLGVYEIDTFTPIINPPECAILGIGRLVEKMVVREGSPTVRTMLTLSLTFDHRLVDGAPAARFLQRVKQLVETPYLWLA
jgi:pyruvate dehydrogenase E2 component (dihydrolipoamide acetyltransferase)